MKRFLHYLFMFLAVICLTLGIFNYAVWAKITDPIIYTDALSNAGVYDQVSEIAESYVVYAVTGLSEQVIPEIATGLASAIFNKDNTPAANALAGVVVSLVNEKLPELVSKGFTSNDVSGRIETFSNNTITSVVLWMKGEKPDPQIFRYIPSTQELRTLKADGMVKIFSTYILANLLGVTDLPQCQTKEEASQNLYLLDAGQIKDMTCVTEGIRPLLYQSISQTLPTRITDQLQLSLESLLEHYNILPVLETIYSLLLGLSYIKEVAITIQEGLYIMKNTGLFLMLVSVFAGGLAIFTSNKRRLRTFSYITLVSGFILVAFGLLYKGLVTYVLNTLNLSSIDLSNEVITSARSSVFMESISKALYEIGIGLYSLAFTSGQYLFMSGLVILIASILLDKYGLSHKASVRLRLKYDEVKSEIAEYKVELKKEKKKSKKSKQNPQDESVSEEKTK